jgi:hypothetical protein
MTDIGNWPELIEVKHDGYILVPLNGYQMGNLLDALTQVRDSGDWWSELQDIIAVAMKKAGIDSLQSNNGTTFTHEQVAARNIMASVRAETR